MVGSVSLTNACLQTSLESFIVVSVLAKRVGAAVFRKVTSLQVTYRRWPHTLVEDQCNNKAVPSESHPWPMKNSLVISGYKWSKKT